jgi:hypothetical protein
MRALRAIADACCSQTSYRLSPLISRRGKVSGRVRSRHTP